MAKTTACGRCVARATAIAPQPVPTSAMATGRVRSEAKRLLDQQLRLRPRDERVRRRPPGRRRRTPCGRRCRRPARAPGGARRDAGRRAERFVDVVVDAGEEPGALQAEDVAQEDFRLQLGVFDAGFFEAALRGVERFRQRHTSCSSSRRACSLVETASIRASRSPLEDARQVVQRQADAVVGDAVLREVVGAYLLRSLAAAHLRPPRLRDLLPPGAAARSRGGGRAARPWRERGSSTASARPGRRRRCRSVCA